MKTRRTVVIAAVSAIALLGLTGPSALANLSGSDFDAHDGNLVLNDEALDWQNAPNLAKGLDKPTGQNDDSFGQGTKEDTAVPSVTNGSIPNNKSDLTRFYVANNRQNDDEFLYLAWERVQDPNGTTNMDFEFNQSKSVSGNGVTPVRTAGDVLIKYDLSKGGTDVHLGYHLWVTSGAASQCASANATPCWGTLHELSGANFEGAINTGQVSDPIDPGAPRNLSARTFGEAAINLTDSGILPPGSCEGFGRAYLKSRSSDSFTSEIKDFIAPIPVNVSNCGKIIIKKKTDPSPDPTDTSFPFTLQGGPSSLDQSFSLKNGESHDSGNVFAGNGYNAAETVPANWDLTDATCDDGSPVTNIDVSVGETVTCTFTNTLLLGGVKIVKHAKHAGSGSANLAATFQITDVNGDKHTATTDSATGVACVDNLPLGAATVKETAGQDGYALDTHTADVTVTTADCPSPGDGATAEFTNTPKTDVTWSVDSQVTGGTHTVVDCKNADGSLTGYPKTVEDGTDSLTGLLPTSPDTTVTCTFTVDP